MKDAWRDKPTGSRLESVRFAVVQYEVVPLVPALQTIADVFLGGSRLETEKCIRKMVTKIVELWREIIRFWLALLADERGLRIVLVHMMRNGPEIVKKLAIHRPAAIAVPHRAANQARPFLSDRVGERYGLFAFMNDPAESFVGHSSLVCRWSCRGEPAFVDSPPLRPVCRVVLGCKFYSPTRHQKRARYPGGRETEKAFSGLKCLSNKTFWLRWRRSRRRVSSLFRNNRLLGHVEKAPLQSSNYV